MALEIDAGASDYMSDLGPQLLGFFRDRHILLRPLGNTIYVMPPYCISPQELDTVYVVIEEAIHHFGTS